MPVKYYTGEDLGGAMQVTSLQDPAASQDVATKHYADTHVPTPFSKQILWEAAYSMTCGNNSYTGAYAAISTGPNYQNVTKLRADTGIRVKLGTSCFTNTPGYVIYGFTVNGSAVFQIVQYFINIASCHMTIPWAEKTLMPAQAAQVGVTGSIQIGFLIQTQASLIWNTNSGDTAWWTISEVMP